MQLVLFPDVVLNILNMCEQPLHWCVGHVAPALSPAHHPDLKSPNMLVERHWRVKVTDFNLSRMVQTASSGSSVNSLLANNPRWLAPEVRTPFLFSSGSELLLGAEASTMMPYSEDLSTPSSSSAVPPLSVTIDTDLLVSLTPSLCDLEFGLEVMSLCQVTPG